MELERNPQDTTQPLLGPQGSRSAITDQMIPTRSVPSIRQNTGASHEGVPSRATSKSVKPNVLPPYYPPDLIKPGSYNSRTEVTVEESCHPIVWQTLAIPYKSSGSSFLLAKIDEYNNTNRQTLSTDSAMLFQDDTDVTHKLIKLIGNQCMLRHELSVISQQVASIDGADNAQRAQESADKAEQAAVKAATCAMRAGTAEEVHAAADPLLQKLNEFGQQLQQLRGINQQLSEQNTRMAKLENKGCCSCIVS